jgi:hypothetical protein
MKCETADFEFVPKEMQNASLRDYDFLELDTRSIPARAAFAPREKQMKRECVSMWTDIHLHVFYDCQIRRK